VTQKITDPSDLAPQIAPVLEIIFIKSIAEGKVPQHRKLVNVTPIIIKGNRHWKLPTHIVNIDFMQGP
jgi:hypothetical protein